MKTAKCPDKNCNGVGEQGDVLGRIGNELDVFSLNPLKIGGNAARLAGKVAQREYDGSKGRVSPYFAQLSECNSCGAPILQCSDCNKIWSPKKKPKVADVVTCPRKKCKHRLTVEY